MLFLRCKKIRSALYKKGEGSPLLSKGSCSRLCLPPGWLWPGVSFLVPREAPAVLIGSQPCPGPCSARRSWALSVHSPSTVLAPLPWVLTRCTFTPSLRCGDWHWLSLCRAGVGGVGAMGAWGLGISAAGSREWHAGSGCVTRGGMWRMWQASHKDVSGTKTHP